MGNQVRLTAGCTRSEGVLRYWFLVIITRNQPRAGCICKPSSSCACQCACHVKPVQVTQKERSVSLYRS